MQLDAICAFPKAERRGTYELLLCALPKGLVQIPESFFFFFLGKLLFAEVEAKRLFAGKVEDVAGGPSSRVLHQGLALLPVSTVARLTELT